MRLCVAACSRRIMVILMSYGETQLSASRTITLDAPSALNRLRLSKMTLFRRRFLGTEILEFRP
jgi:hypothetical protein